MRDQIEHWQRYAERLKEENEELWAEVVDLRRRLAEYEGGSQDEPAES